MKRQWRNFLMELGKRRARKRDGFFLNILVKWWMYIIQFVPPFDRENIPHSSASSAHIWTTKSI